MKKLLIILLLGVCSASFAQTCYSAKDFFKQKSIVWYGVDYSKAKFIGSFGQVKSIGSINGYDLKDRYFSAWNYLPIKEREKFNIKKFFKKEIQYDDVNSVEMINREVEPDNLMQNDDYVLEKSSLAGMVSKYQSTKKTEGIGVVFITEKYDQTQNLASYYVVVFDIASKEILITDKFSAQPGGIGIKAYWGNTILGALEHVHGKYGKWKRKYA